MASSALPALLFLTFVVAVMAIAPAPSPTTDVSVRSEKFMGLGDPMKCWNVIEGVEGCSAQLFKALTEMNFNFLPDCCKAIVNLPVNCVQWIFPFPLGASFGDQAIKFCNNLPREKFHPIF